MFRERGRRQLPARAGEPQPVNCDSDNGVRLDTGLTPPHDQDWPLSASAGLPEVAGPPKVVGSSSKTE